MATVINQPEKELKVVGTSPVRPDGVPKVTGTAQYGADFTLPGMLWGKVLRSPHAHARIRSIDTAKAEKLPGVKADISLIDTSAAEAATKVRYQGQEIAAVAAETEEIAASARGSFPGQRANDLSDGSLAMRVLAACTFRKSRKVPPDVPLKPGKYRVLEGDGGVGHNRLLWGGFIANHSLVDPPHEWLL